MNGFVYMWIVILAVLGYFLAQAVLGGVIGILRARRDLRKWR